MMNARQAALHQFFTDKARHLQHEIDLEVEKIGGEDMLISREDLIHWVYRARNQVQTYYTICRMLENQAEGADTGKILQELRDTMEADQADIQALKQKQEEEQKALDQLRTEAEYYRQALELLGQ